MSSYKESLDFHKKHHGKLSVESVKHVASKKDLSILYTPGVAEPSRKIAEHPEKVWELTIKSHTVAIVSDGSAVLGLGNIGPEAAIPVMEGKAALLKEFAGIDGFPITLKTQDPKEIVSIVKQISPVFGAVNLEDISAPRCFEIEEKLQDIGIPVMHDDQHGTAMVVLAGILNALKVAGKHQDSIKIAMSGAGAAGMGIFNLLVDYGFDPKNIRMVDSRGIITSKRKGLNKYKRKVAKLTKAEEGSLKDALEGADVFVGVSKAGILNPEWIKQMADRPIIFAMANPEPEIMPDKALENGAWIVATGRSDFPNQVNNVLAFPGVFKGALEARAGKITKEMKIAAAEAIASSVRPTRRKILPSALNRNLSSKVARAVKKAWKK